MILLKKNLRGRDITIGALARPVAIWVDRIWFPTLPARPVLCGFLTSCVYIYIYVCVCACVYKR